jgi:hypothetical protein
MPHKIGYSTGAFSHHNVCLAADTLRQNSIDTIELSALREHELLPLIYLFDSLGLESFKTISFHAPSKLNQMNEEQLTNVLQIPASRGWNIIVHPQVIVNFDLWKRFGSLLCIENMDGRSYIGKTEADFEYLFDRLPNASLCFDIAHVKHFDSTLQEAKNILGHFFHKLKQMHISDISDTGHHLPLTKEVVELYKDIVERYDVPLILESPADNIKEEMELLRGI